MLDSLVNNNNAAKNLMPKFDIKLEIFKKPHSIPGIYGYRARVGVLEGSRVITKLNV